MDEYKILEIKESVFADNDREADALRAVDGLPKVTGSGREAGKIYVSEDVDKTLTAAERKAEGPEGRTVVR